VLAPTGQLSATASSFTFATDVTYGVPEGGATNGDYTSTFYDDGSFHSITVFTGTTKLDCYYQFSVGTTGTAAWCEVHGYFASAHPPGGVNVYAWNWTTSAWDQVGSIPGVSATVDTPQTTDPTYRFPFTASHTAAGLVRVRFYGGTAIGDNLNVDQILVHYTPGSSGGNGSGGSGGRMGISI
jgi:hypothetical protein